MISVLAVGLMALAGCGSDSLDTDDDKGGDVGASVDKDAAALVPQEIKDKGTLTVGADASYAPNEFLAVDGKTDQRGLRHRPVHCGRQEARPQGGVRQRQVRLDHQGAQGGKYDVGVSSFTINTDRMKQVNMVGYFNAGTQWATAPGNPNKLDPEKPCGAAVPVQKGTVEEEEDLPTGSQPARRPAPR